MPNPIVIKFGGSLLDNGPARKVFLRMLADEWTIQQDPKRKGARASIILVHGGGKDITRELEKRKIAAHFDKSGRRITDEATMVVVEEVLARINHLIVEELEKEGARAIGLDGKKGSLVRAKRLPDLGMVGVPDYVDKKAFAELLTDSAIPVFYSVAVGQQGESLNVNADDFAQVIAIAMQAEQLIFMTDSGGIKDKSGRVIGLITPTDIERFIEESVITGGMAVKARACAEALKRGVKSVTITDVVELASTTPPRAAGTRFVGK